MLTIHVRKGLLGEDGIVTQRWPWSDGLSARSIVLQLQDQLPQSMPIDVVVNGTLIEDDYDGALNDGDELVICPHTTYGIEWGVLLAYALIMAVISAGVSYAIMALTPKPKAADDSFERGDSSSATYAWSGITTNYGQGWTLPAIYGRHATGGQVIETNVQASTEAASAVFLNNRLQILLALSEGPIHAIGDKEVSADDYLGSLSLLYTPINPISLPSDVYVNDTLLVNDGQPDLSEYGVSFGTNNWIPQDPDVNPGDVVTYWNATTQQFITEANAPVYVTKVFGSSANPAIRISEPYMTQGALISALNAGDDIRLWINSGPPFSEPERKIAAPTQIIYSIAGSAGCLMFLRSGELDQPALPSNGSINLGWDNTTQVLAVNRELVTFGQTVDVSFNAANDLVSGLRFILVFPGGLYTVNPDGGILSARVIFQMRWRYAGDFFWNDFSGGGGNVVFAASQNSITEQSDVVFTTPVSGLLEFQVERLTGNDPGMVTRCVVQDIIVSAPYEMTYPRVATMGLILSAGARYQGGLPQIQCTVDGILVRVWSATNGWSERCWDVPATPYDWHVYAPGRNPAWVLADFLLQPWGLGDYLTEDDLDLPSFAAWAVWCDRDPNPSDPWGEAQFTVDLVIDRPRPCWEWVMTICAAGRASPVFVNGKISINYQFQAAHAQGDVSIPAKTSTQLFTSNNMQDCNVTWLPRANRPTAFVYQFLNEDENYNQDVLTVEDYEGTLNDPTELHQDKWRPEQQQAYGTTRPSQLFRDGVFRHRINRLVARRIDFKTGRWALAAQIGDYIDVETEVMRPFTLIATSGVILVGGTSVNVLTVDHPTLPSTGSIKYRKDDGSPGLASWISTSSTTIETTLCTVITLASGTAVTVSSGATCVFGSTSFITEQYEVTGITLQDDLSRLVTALQVVDAVHADIVPSAFNDGASTGNAINASPSREVAPKISASNVAIERMTDGQHRLSWLSVGLLSSVTKRIYSRSADSQPWQLLGSTDRDWIDVQSPAVGQPLQLSVTADTFDGDARPPDAGTQLTVTPSEFAIVLPPAVRGGEVGNRLSMRWAPVTTALSEEYELREGQSWVGARVLYRGTQPFVDWAVPPLTSNMHICVENEDGSQGQPTAIALPVWNPDHASYFVDVSVVEDATGTFTNTEIISSSYIQLTATTLSGSYTSPELVPGFKASFLWRVAIDAREFTSDVVNDVRDRLGSGELNWRTVDAREASRSNIGVDFTRDVDDATDKVDHYDDEYAAGYIGAAGHHTRADVQGRFYDGSSWSAWETWNDQYRNAQKAQVRVVMDRESFNFDLQLHQLRIIAQL